MRLTHKQRILNILKDHEWVSSEELHEVSWRFSARLHDLRREGYRFLKKPHPYKNKIEMWKLVYVPEDRKEAIKPIEIMTRQEQMGLL